MSSPKSSGGRPRTLLFCLEIGLISFTVAPLVLCACVQSRSIARLAFVRSPADFHMPEAPQGSTEEERRAWEKQWELPQRYQQFVWAREEDRWPEALQNSVLTFYVFPCAIISFCLGVVLFVVSCDASLTRGSAWRGFGVVIGAALVWGSALFFWLLPPLARAREKPVIYLYPQTEKTVTVKLNYPGVLLHTYPAYSSDGWKVLAKPSGELVDLRTGRKHACLFWEGRDNLRFDLSTGFVVEGRNTASFLEEKLATLGLSETEADEFIIYWLPRLEKNRFNVIHFATEEWNERVPIEVTPVPDTVIRVLMVYKAASTPPQIEPQVLTPAVRHRFTVVEWGGTEVE